MDSFTTQDVLKLMGSHGPFAEAIEGYESRPQQIKMLERVLEAYEKGQIALIEAGTGTGKSLAYLLPAVLQALHHGQRTVISTHTINLQEQLLFKDIPLLQKALDCDFKAVLVKGMSNYICYRKLEEALQEKKSLSLEHLEQLEEIEQWSTKSYDGTKSDLSFGPSKMVWDKVSAESDACSHNKCPHFKQCPFFRDRRQANDAHILVVNHHLLFSDISERPEGNFDEQCILPHFEHLILDEAHNVEDVATEHFASNVDSFFLKHQLNKLLWEKGAYLTRGKLDLLKKKVRKLYQHNENLDVAEILQKLDFDLPGSRRSLLVAIEDFFERLSGFCAQCHPNNVEESNNQQQKQWRIKVEHLENPFWVEELIPQADDLIEKIKNFAEDLNTIKEGIEFLDNSKLQEQVSGLLLDINAIRKKLANAAKVIGDFFYQDLTPTGVRWIEKFSDKRHNDLRIVNADLDISTILSQTVFTNLCSVVLCSATLTTNSKFNFIKERLGLLDQHLEGRTVSEDIFSSPFDYDSQVLLAVPPQLPQPNHPSFIAVASRNILETVKISRGNAFILFTSYSMLKNCYDNLSEQLKGAGFPTLKQGDESRQALLEKFKITDGAVLFGTDSFWEGVDVVGDALRCIIIAKLPFKVPNEPITEARSELILQQGGNPFFDYTVPTAVVKFKQGFGRLIRNSSDRGCIVCLDPRLVQKSYGKIFVNSLPPCRQLFDASLDFMDRIAEFYRLPQ
ncbi:MAG: ATP-dependent DNA helicase [Chlamydiota bacterium]